MPDAQLAHGVMDIRVIRMNLDGSYYYTVTALNDDQPAVMWAPKPPRWYRRWWSKLLWHTINKYRFTMLGYVDD